MTTGEMTYEAVVGRLESALKFGIHPSLDTIASLTAALSSPQDAFASIQVTGTNGKTSVTRLVAAFLHAHGFRTGCYTSPHLQEYRERIEIDGMPIARRIFARCVENVLEAAGRIGAEPTEFELLTAAALDAFRVAEVDYAALEVGLGGRWDATSVVSPVVSVITGVALDHTAHLGSTRQEIARDKAHIIKPGSVAVLGPGTGGVDDILRARAETVGAHVRAVRESGATTPLPEEVTARFEVLARPSAPDGVTRMRIEGIHADYGELRISAPAYQAANVATSIAAAEAALGRPLEAAAIEVALATTRFPARFEVFPGDPLVVVDGSHNPEAATVLAGAVRAAFGEERPIVLLGVLADKDARGIIEALAPVAREFVVTAPGSPRAVAVADLATVAREVTGTAPARYPDVRAALTALLEPGAPPLLIAGSLTTAGEARSLLSVR